MSCYTTLPTDNATRYGTDAEISVLHATHSLTILSLGSLTYLLLRSPKSRMWKIWGPGKESTVQHLTKGRPFPVHDPFIHRSI